MAFSNQLRGMCASYFNSFNRSRAKPHRAHNDSASVGHGSWVKWVNESGGSRDSVPVTHDRLSQLNFKNNNQ